MIFKKYSSIENSSRKKTIDYIIECGYSVLPYVVQEKAHGSNYSIYLTKQGPRAYKRSGLAESDFYSHTRVLEKYADELNKIYEKHGELFLNGELIGGSYPHPEVESTNYPAVQKGIHYHPDLEFYLFDIRKEENKFVNVAEFEDLASSMPFCWAKTLFRGSFQECLEYNNEYQTTIPDFFSLPPIDGNICEGNVIKPVEDMYFGSGRVILKNKNEKFAETAFKSNKPKQNVELTDEQNSILSELAQYITENRLRNVLSKFGSVKNSEFGKLNGLFVQDILEEYGKVDKLLNKQLNKECANFLRERFVNIIDGEF